MNGKTGIKGTRKALVVDNKADGVLFAMFDNEYGERPVGTAMVTVSGENAIVWSVCVVKSFQRKGYGSTMVRRMKELFDVIETGWLNAGGKALFLSCGFEYPESEPNGGTLCWVKGEEYAGKDKKN